MKKNYCGASVYDTDTHSFVPRNIIVEDDRIVDLTPVERSVSDCKKIDCTGLYIIPGLVDVHTHGRAGFDFTAIDEKDIDELMLSYARAGTTTVMPTLASDTHAVWKQKVSMLTAYAHSRHSGAHIPGIHLEGRYLCEERRGAHASEFLCPLSIPELSELRALSPQDRMHISIAPELEGGETFLREAVRLGISVGIAHSNASYEEAIAAISWGAVAFTHTFNAMSPLHHRMPGCVGAALLTDAAFAELICDGMHSHPAISQLLAKNKPADKLVLITDSMAATGCPDGEYFIGGLPVFVNGGRALTEDGHLAGSTLTLFDGLCNFMRFTGRTLEEALPCASENPARMIGVFDTLGSISVGKRADFLLIDDKTAPRLHGVVLGGSVLEN